MPTPGALAVDFGASHTFAMIRRDDGTVEQLLSDSSPPVLASMLERIRDEYLRRRGRPPVAVTLTHPATWGPARCLELADAARWAGLANAVVLPAPVAAVRHLVTGLRHRLPTGSAVIVADFGGTGFTASVVARTPDGLELLAADELAGPASDDGPPWVESAVRVGRAVLGGAAVPPARITAVLPIGAASGTPLATEAIQRAFGRVPLAIQRPDLAVVNGALLATPTGAGPRRRVTTMVLAAAAVVALLVLGITVAGNATVSGATGGPRSDVLRDAKPAAVALFSYDYRSLDASISEAKSHATASFAKEFDDQLDKLRPTIERDEATIRAQVVDIGFVEETDEGAELLAFINQKLTNRNIAGSRIDKVRVTMTMVPGHDGWKVDDVTAL